MLTRPAYRHGPAISTNPRHFYKKTLIPRSMIFQKSQPPINKGVHIMETMISVKEVTLFLFHKKHLLHLVNETVKTVVKGNH